ncbi:hypothetical protein Tcan_04114 [Toxocara canis]|uniref:Uncharacterized protein n=1 Tax=Toxocara canis TaxID=6265 RepID=A0A0B2VLL5_TOXCA|nr:hypothetical protein Tcan_04114 [Toxocara canis]
MYNVRMLIDQNRHTTKTRNTVTEWRHDPIKATYRGRSIQLVEFPRITTLAWPPDKKRGEQIEIRERSVCSLVTVISAWLSWYANVASYFHRSSSVFTWQLSHRLESTRPGWEEGKQNEIHQEFTAPCTLLLQPPAPHSHRSVLSDHTPHSARKNIKSEPMEIIQ